MTDRLPLAQRPVLLAGFSDIRWLEGASLLPGQVQHLDRAAAIQRARQTPPLLCHLPTVLRRLRCERFPAFDLLELFAFVRPASFCLPTARGLAEALGLPMAPQAEGGDLQLLRQAAAVLLRELSALTKGRRRLLGLAHYLTRAGWSWGPEVLAALTGGGAAAGVASSSGEAPLAAKVTAVPGIAVWEDLPEWSETAAEPPGDSWPVEPDEIRHMLAEILHEGAEQRPQQMDYATSLAPAFAPRLELGAPNLVLAEAGTGVGKTLGYLTPASLWARKNKAPVWISTYTRHLQHQIDQELDRFHPNAAVKSGKVVIRKGRENYLCLLNLAETAHNAGQAQTAIAAGLMARWVMATRDGDMIGGDLPGWLPDLLGIGRVQGLADRRGECIYAACPHYTRCFIERSVRRARKAEIVIANHALVMIQAALSGDEQQLPVRYVFDEGHHLFSAIDSAFAAHLTGQETLDLRRWLLGAEGGRSSRARGLKRRIEDLILDDATAIDLMQQVIQAARILASEGWHQRLIDAHPAGPVEAYLAAVRRQILARAPNDGAGYSLETATLPLDDRVAEAAEDLDQAFHNLQRPLRDLAARLAKQLDTAADTLDTPQRLRIEALSRGLARRAENELGAWRAMLASLKGNAGEDFVDWFALDRVEGREFDVGHFRHWLDPTKPFAEVVAKPAHGIVITSATLTDGSGTAEAWAAAELRTGAVHLPSPAVRARVASPFDYAAQTRVFIVNDLGRNDLEQLAAAYRSLFLAAGGGALGLFTAIARLREVHRRIAPVLEQAGIDLLAQHVDAMENSTLIDIFRGEVDACLLGTDAVRDGVDVPGRALRLIVFDRVPWPRPDLLHKARKASFGGAAYDDQLTRLKLKQAFGRLVRRADDHGVFVLLDKAMPSRLLTAFPEGVTVERLGLAEVIRRTREFLTMSAAPAEMVSPGSEHNRG
ncbi:MAG TPA: ATP-dependent DNA helicase [Dongiaceae bacterium]|nr:ATP-dependent DNA helicase [Dongiaceae bacterium]